ncbi:UDP-N-acetylmuramate--L-alanine ligase [Pedobacter sp. MC2016-24]|uniref:UDP-N-acetylmuramate--L-alanine ligase n=1 Tax=Pedobacter sp. MC2016-24 TaxID=2780090 RepID=UPI001882A91E|nr:UDP-N-acetylmuramate--L-alanine ligase [Pedobacter sp. MC2016-24]MBE9603051.1 UDP-N-acetylmuramate--L-alanine ligase [Pedobacter sp. MC2016-24]
MELNTIQRVYFVGVGGIGMSAIARYFVKRGCLVCGYDKTRTDLCSVLEDEGIQITYADEVSGIPAEFKQKDVNTLIVYTPAIPGDSKIIHYFKAEGFEIRKRSEVLGIISKGQFCIAVAGTHGKTTTSSIIAHVLVHSGFGCTAFLGGIATNYNSNFLFNDNHVVVVEADEYDRSFLTLHPDISVVTSMDADHLDIYGDAAHLQESFRLFAAQLKPNGALYIKEGLPLEHGIGYSVNGTSEIRAEQIRVVDSKFVFDYVDGQQVLNDIHLMLPGKHNVENAVAAIAVALKLGIDPEKIKAGIASFKGVKRRFEYHVNAPGKIYVDDYAHHPEELRACFDAVRQLYPDKKLTVVFQPHLFTRTRDFADDFAKVLSTVDDLILLDIYPARELPLEGVTSRMLLDRVTLNQKEISTKALLPEKIKDKNPELLLTVGAGDIDTLIQPLKAIMSHA